MISLSNRLYDSSYPRNLTDVPQIDQRTPSYRLRFARDGADLLDVQRLRFEVFNLERAEGLSRSFERGLDQDEHDSHCHHLMVTSSADGRVVGTYRLQTRPMAEAGAGWYGAAEFELAGLPPALLDLAVETGRACVAREHRNGRVLQLLWRGLAQYLAHNQKRYIFGCTSLSSTSPHVAQAAFDALSKAELTRRDLAVRPRLESRAFEPGFVAAQGTPFDLPPLFTSYLDLGARVLCEPALDADFGTLDFLTLLDVQDLRAAAQRMFFSRAA